MKTTDFDPKSIILDGRLDEVVWENAKVITGFKKMGLEGPPVDPAHDTVVKILPMEDRIFFGIQCMEPDMVRLKNAPAGIFNTTDSVELFLSPSGTPYDCYQFFVSCKGTQIAYYYEEEGNIKPDPYAPEWYAAVYYGENYWSVEMEFPLTAFYMTGQGRWNDKWLMNVARVHFGPNGSKFSSTWSKLYRKFVEPHNFRLVEGFPIRDPKNDVCITSALVNIAEEKADGYHGSMTVSVKTAVAGAYELVTDYSKPAVVTLQEGINEFAVPCAFPELNRFKMALALTRKEDDVTFKRKYPVKVTYEPIVLKFTRPEYRTNFYPGQDTTKIVGTAVSSKPVTLTLEGPGIPKQVITPDADGKFLFETPDFQVGDAIFTASIDGYTITRKIRNLPPTGHMMTWISGGNLIVNGKAVLRRNMYSQYYCGGEAFKRKYDADDLHQTKEIHQQYGNLEPGQLIKGAEGADGEAAKDAKPTEEMLRKVDEVLEYNKDKDFAFYYISDEPECRGLSEIYFSHLYNYIAEKDPYHVVLTATRSANRMINIADWFETHPYINAYINEKGERVYARPIHTLGKFIDDIAKLERPDKCIGLLPTCFAGMPARKEPYPTFDELLCNTWAPMLRGGKTLWPYAYHDMNDRAALYEGMRYVFTSFEALDQFVLHAKRTVLINTQDVESVLYELGEEKMFVLTNKTLHEQDVTLEGVAGTWHAFRHNGLITGNSFHLKPYEVVIGTSEVKDQGLPTYEETVALIAEKEYVRTHRGSLFFEHQKDIPITTSGYNGWIFKIFDGVQDNYAWSQAGEMEKFAELDLTKVKPTFRKLVVHGFQVDDLVLTVQNGKEVSVPAIVEKKTEEFSTTFLFENPICPDKLRLEFKADRVELYEIEAF